ncbi:hypothetical protein F5X68DRAFT_258924 [Plectosphaerella plurivora]|uniref:Uncharacterized protein n=1 Tax=Plectosphaerella plurivora TaxID=936078 RepID=A0A9P9AB10_9PEZI|nr:hypothetical protein F5X68DRAFT_258924 [Plectosphaerella plurivora]
MVPSVDDETLSDRDVPPNDSDTDVSDQRRLVPDNSDDLPPVTFRPIVLRPWMLALCLVFLLACLVLLAVALYVSEWEVENFWTNAFLTILPYILGTTSAVWVQSIVTNLSRMTPFLLCASKDGALATHSIFQECFPVPSMWDAWRCKCWFLVLSHLISWLTAFLVALKASLLGADRETGEFWIVSWAAQVLLGIYAAASLYIIGVACYLHERDTGLREDWDPVNIADHMAQFRHSDFLHLFAGTGGVERDSMIADPMLSTLKLKLGYWRLGECGERWYGFGFAQGNEEADELLKRSRDADRDRSLKFSKAELERVANKSVYSFVNPKSFDCQLAFWTSVVLSSGYIAMLFLGRTRDNTFIVPIPVGWGVVLFQLIPIQMFGMFVSFWSDARIFAATTQPFVGMREPGGRPAQDTILLDYNCLSSVEQIMLAVKNQHWKVAFAVVASAMHRLLPNLAGPSLMISQSDSKKTIVELNVPLVAFVSAWLVVEVVLIPWATLTGVETRYLPRDYLCIGDLVSWMCTSNVFEVGALSDSHDDALHVPVETQPYQSQKADMEARLRLSRQHFRFGVVPTRGSPGQYMIGLGVANSDEPELAEDQQLSLLGAKGFVMVTGAEGTVDDVVAARVIRAQGAQDEEEETDEQQPVDETRDTGVTTWGVSGVEFIAHGVNIVGKGARGLFEIVGF